MKALRLAFFATLWVGLLTTAGLADDGWRRTTYGWEHVSSWEQSHFQEVEPVPEPMHPLHLATIQVVVSMLALAHFAPNRNQDRSP